MKTQKEVQLISFELKDYRIIRAVKLDFEKWQDENILEIVGDMGNGKSSLLEGIEMATTGVEHIKDKDLLNLGFKSEVQLVDGEHRIYLGVKVSEISRGDRKGEPKFETYLYEKDESGKLITNPIIDGKKATAKEYTDLLSTALTFRMADMFSENQTTHRKLIESLFNKELSKLGVDEILKKIKDAKEDRDYKRHERDRSGVSMEGFKEGGYKEEYLENLEMLGESTIESEIKKLEVEKEILLKNPEKEKESKLNAIKGKGIDIVSEIEKLNNVNKSKAFEEFNEWQTNFTKLEKIKSSGERVKTVLETEKENLFAETYSNVDKELQAFSKKINTLINTLGDKPQEYPNIPIVDGKLDIPATIPEEYESFINTYKAIQKEYVEVRDSEIGDVDTTKIDNEIKKLSGKLTLAKENNKLLEQYQIWKDWIEASGIYEKEVDNLRKLYTKIETGVDGLKIIPNMTNSGKLEIWLEYNGSHDTELFKNKKKDYRRLYEYSKSQGAIIGILLQASILDKKDKVLRLVVLDDATQTKAGKKLLGNICKEKNLKLIIAKTSDEYDLSKLSDGTVVIENGEVLV